jgi:hypothetical protein
MERTLSREADNKSAGQKMFRFLGTTEFIPISAVVSLELIEGTPLPDILLPYDIFNTSLPATHSAVSIVTRIRAGRSGVRNPSLKCPDKLWGPPSLLHN